MSIELPTHDDISDRRSKGDALTALELFIYDWEPVAAGEWRAQVAAVVAAASGQWRPIETAPKSTSTPTPFGHDVRGAYFLAYCPDEGSDPQACICVCWWEPHEKGGCWYGDGGFSLRPTHWMPLPAAPVAP